MPFKNRKLENCAPQVLFWPFSGINNALIGFSLWRHMTGFVVEGHIYSQESHLFISQQTAFIQQNGQVYDIKHNYSRFTGSRGCWAVVATVEARLSEPRGSHGKSSDN